LIHRELTGLYVHIPFCKSKCPYCASYSRPVVDADTGALVDAIINEIDLLTESDVFHELDTIYIGGGTPTALSDSELKSLLDALQPFIIDAAEITSEVNPESASPEKLSLLRKNGINRLSIGIQSFDDEELNILGRKHDSEGAIKAFNAAREAGFENISVDLMYGLPEQKFDSWINNLDTAIGLGPEHISFYGLTLEEGTEFSRLYSGDGDERLPSDEMFRKMYYTGIGVLSSKGFNHYEISNFARPGFASKHNMNYWRHGKYAAAGPSAAGFDGHRRWKNVSDIGIYFNAMASGKSPVDEEEILTVEQLISEAMMLGLRLIDGIRLDDISRKCERDIGGLYKETIRRQVKTGLVAFTDGVLRLTRDGLFVSDGVISEYMLV
jgi:oxygen-independent coproporphyrinogen-3 oxidase